MHPSRTRRRALLAAALPAALAAAALPAGAQAATAKVDAGPVLEYTESPGETNQLRVAVTGNQIVISDTTPITAGNGCTLDVAGDARCRFDVNLVNVQLGDGNDRVEYAAPHQAAVVGGRGDDLFLGALRQVGVGRAMEPAFYQGGTGTDTVSYRFADRGVRVDTDDNLTTNPDLATDGWRHPRAWRQLRAIELRLTRDGVPVGAVTIVPARERITADGAVSLGRRTTRLTRDGKTVVARLPVRLDESLAGQTLRAEVEASDRRGRRQLERDAATVRVAK